MLRRVATESSGIGHCICLSYIIREAIRKGSCML